ncbi:MAG: hypothetical protein QXV32_06810 [Conexivisphaerales archaeon]
MRNSYQVFGAFMVGFGLVVSSISYFILSSIPFTALGIGALIIGVASMMLPPSPVPKSLVSEMLRNSATNIEALLEEFQVSGKALFLPPREGYVTAFLTIEDVPLAEVAESPEIPLRVLSIASGRRGLRIFPPGSELARSAEAYEEQNYEQLLSLIIVDQSELAQSVKVVSKNEQVVVEINRPKVLPKLPRFNRSLGTLPSCIAATCLAFSSGKRVAIEEERVNDDKILLSLRLFAISNDKVTDQDEIAKTKKDFIASE